jgi:hypothetical protein
MSTPFRTVRRMPQEKHFTLDVRFVHETDSAVLIEDLETEEEFWIPFSQVKSMERGLDDTGSITMTRWIAEQKGLV